MRGFAESAATLGTVRSRRAVLLGYCQDGDATPTNICSNSRLADDANRDLWILRAVCCDNKG